jgi:hypothetical protein
MAGDGSTTVMISGEIGDRVRILRMCSVRGSGRQVSRERVKGQRGLAEFTFEWHDMMDGRRGCEDFFALCTIHGRV